MFSTLRPLSSGLRGRPTDPDGSHLVLMPPPSFDGGGSGGGSRGGPVGSFARTSLSHSSLHVPRHATVHNSMQLVLYLQSHGADNKFIGTILG